MWPIHPARTTPTFTPATTIAGGDSSSHAIGTRTCLPYPVAPLRPFVLPVLPVLPAIPAVIFDHFFVVSTVLLFIFIVAFLALPTLLRRTCVAQVPQVFRRHVLPSRLPVRLLLRGRRFLGRRKRCKVRFSLSGVSFATFREPPTLFFLLLPLDPHSVTHTHGAHALFPPLPRHAAQSTQAVQIMCDTFRHRSLRARSIGLGWSGEAVEAGEAGETGESEESGQSCLNR